VQPATPFGDQSSSAVFLDISQPGLNLVKAITTARRAEAPFGLSIDSDDICPKRKFGGNTIFNINIIIFIFLFILSYTCHLINLPLVLLLNTNMSDRINWLCQEFGA